MSPAPAVAAGQRWHCDVCKHDHEMFDEKHVASCLTCPCEHRYGDNVMDEPTALARLEAAGPAMTWPDVALAYERGAKP